jgi:hypothetical protein
LLRYRPARMCKLYTRKLGVRHNRRDVSTLSLAARESSLSLLTELRTILSSQIYESSGGQV